MSINSAVLQSIADKLGSDLITLNLLLSSISGFRTRPLNNVTEKAGMSKLRAEELLQIVLTVVCLKFERVGNIEIKCPGN